MRHICRSKFNYIAITVALNLTWLCLDVYSQTTPDFGPNVIIFNPATPAATIQSTLNSIFALQSDVNASQFDTNRYAILFQPGTYINLDINMGYYMQVLGLGQTPDQVTINGMLESYGFNGGNATENFWMSAENLALAPTDSNTTIIWAVSQGTSLRRVHVKGSLALSAGGYSSGGFLADSRIDSTVSSGSQQQWLSRNDVWGNWSGQVWNMVFVGVSNAPSGTWPGTPFTVITNTPLVREKPYLAMDSNTNYFVIVPSLQTNTLGTTWATGPTPGVSISIDQFYLAHAGVDNAASINEALSSGKHLIFTPGIYHLTNSILVTQPDTIILGLGFATLVSGAGTPAMVVSDVDGVKISGLIFDAGPQSSASLLQVGSANNPANHSADPICLYDISMRVGGATSGKTSSCLTINANDVLADNLWLWRADHGTGVGWTKNVCNNGLIVNGDRVTIYGLFVEHHEQYQTLWNGNWGRVYFYQSELPYDAPSQAAWSHNGVSGYASYKVADSVTSHQAYGLGIYGVFISSITSCFDTIETPTTAQQVNVHDMINVYITGQGVGEMTHIINGTGGTVGPDYGQTTANHLWQNPKFNAGAGSDGSSIAVLFPTESWHSYQLQYKNALTDPAWSNLGGAIGGNDALQTLTDSTSTSSRFYRVMAY